MKSGQKNLRFQQDKQAQKLDYVIDMQVMVVDAFQQVNDLVALETTTLDVVEKAFKVVNEL